VFGCGPISRWEDTDACVVQWRAQEPDWRRVLARVDSLSVSTLVTPEADNRVVRTDGFHVVFEVLAGSAYHTASFRNPRADATSHEGRAAMIVDVLERIWNAAVRDTTSRAR
jgi:hypothetical protein